MSTMSGKNGVLFVSLLSVTLLSVNHFVTNNVKSDYYNLDGNDIGNDKRLRAKTEGHGAMFSGGGVEPLNEGVDVEAKQFDETLDTSRMNGPMNTSSHDQPENRNHDEITSQEIEMKNIKENTDMVEGSTEEEEEEEEEEVEGSGTEDYCTADGSICAYHKICYDTTDGSWHTSASSMRHFPLLNDSNFKTHSDHPIKDASGCSEKFVPKSNRSYPSQKEMEYVSGTTYLVCCWVNQFGHILVQMMASAVHALEKMGLKRRFRSNAINFLVDNRASHWGSTDTVLNVFEFLTKKSNRVLSLQDLGETVKQDNKDKICFQKLVVGMLYDDLVHGGPKKSHPPDANTNMLLPIRDHLESMYPLTKESALMAVEETKFSPEFHVKESTPECTITFLRRRGDTRRMANFDGVMEVAEKIFFEPKWSIRTVAFDGPSLESQYLTVRSSTVFISVSGTGSHMAMFLPEGGKSVEIQYNIGERMKNRYICTVTPNLSCHAADSTCSEDYDSNCKNADFVYVDLDSFESTIEDVKADITSKCDESLNYV